MIETWLNPNRRALALGMVLPAMETLVGVALVSGALPWGGRIAELFGVFTVLVGLAQIASLAWQMRMPRIAYERGELLFYLRRQEPLRVPIDVVECFFIGQGPAMIPGDRDRGRQGVNVIVRLAERATEWADRDVNRSLAAWCQSYITIRGAWCEPLDEKVVNGLNRRLANAMKLEKSC